LTILNSVLLDNFLNCEGNKEGSWGRGERKGRREKEKKKKAQLCV
jgi:hypothetical protein